MLTIVIIGLVFIICALIISNYYINENENTTNANDDNITNTNNESKSTINHFEPKILSVLEHGFHDNFADNNKLLGWRHWYLKNKSDYQVKPSGNFDDIWTRNYLDSMCSLDNWFNDLYSGDIDSKIIE